MSILDNTVRVHLNFHLETLEKQLDASIGSYIGHIDDSCLRVFRNLVESMKRTSPEQDRMALVLRTPGGSVETVEKMVEIMRHHFKEVYFVIPEMAMSAGTILSMSGDKIFMDYASSLGPIDPQVPGSDGHWVPALGYLDQFERLIEKSKDDEITAVEFSLVQNMDLAKLRRFEQARDLSVTLLKKWLVEYKFRDWNEHQTNPDMIGRPVSIEEKEQRAEEIASLLGNHKHWHSHSRMIGVRTLTDPSMLKLKIDDYTDDEDTKQAIGNYYELLIDYVQRHSIPVFCHARGFF